MKENKFEWTMIMFIVVIIVGIVMYLNKKESSVQVGKTYVFTIPKENPFEKDRIDTLKILAIKEGYAQYIDQDSNVNSSSLEFILMYSKEIICK
jgi:energy-converting hydrogenase Eha subunit H